MLNILSGEGPIGVLRNDTQFFQYIHTYIHTYIRIMKLRLYSGSALPFRIFYFAVSFIEP